MVITIIMTMTMTMTLTMTLTMTKYDYDQQSLKPNSGTRPKSGENPGYHIKPSMKNMNTIPSIN